MRTVDIAIIGGGIAGLSAAAFLSGRQTAVLIEREHALGYHSTGRSAAEFVLGHNAVPVRALARIAERFFRNPPPGFADVPLLRPLGCVMIADQDRRADFDAAMAQEREASPDLREISPDEAVALAPVLKHSAFAHAYYDPAFFTIEVESLIQGYRRMAKAAGVEILTSAGLSAARREGEFWMVETAAGPIRARTIVNAAGAWADHVAESAGLQPLGIVPHRRTAILVDPPAGMDLRAMPEIGDIDDSFYFKPDGGRLMACPCDETPVEPQDAAPEELDIAWAAHHVSEKTIIDVRRIAGSWAGLRSFAPDRLPVAGFDPRERGFFWLAGQGGFGILTSPALGQMSAALIEGRALDDAFAENGLSAASFDPARFSR